MLPAPAGIQFGEPLYLWLLLVPGSLLLAWAWRLFRRRREVRRFRDTRVGPVRERFRIVGDLLLWHKSQRGTFISSRPKKCLTVATAKKQ